MAAIDLLKIYAQRIRDLRRANADVPETALAPEFQQLLNGLIPLINIAPQLKVVPEYRNPGVGRPDIALVRQGAFARAFGVGGDIGTRRCALPAPAGHKALRCRRYHC